MIFIKKYNNMSELDCKLDTGERECNIYKHHIYDRIEYYVTRTQPNKFNLISLLTTNK